MVLYILKDNAVLLSVQMKHRPSIKPIVNVSANATMKIKSFIIRICYFVNFETQQFNPRV